LHLGYIAAASVVAEEANQKRRQQTPKYDEPWLDVGGKVPNECAEAA
jgi:hypothetical protein